MIGSGVVAAVFRPCRACYIQRRCTYLLPSSAVAGRFTENDESSKLLLSCHSTRTRRRSSSSSPPSPNSSDQSQERGLLRAFASDWNQTLSQHPQTVLASFLSIQSTTWLGLYTALSLSSGMVVIPPSLAAGWAVSKFSKKFRQPVNAAMAAVLVKVVPMLGEVKVTPLVTGLVMGDKDKQIIAKQVEEKAPSAIPIIQKVAKASKWLEGPIDKYGLSYYLSSRISGVSTLCIASYLIHQGVDISVYLSSWGGMVEGVGEAVGTAAAASVLNVFFVPLHFYSCVYGVRALEGGLKSLARGVVDAKIDAEREFRRDYRNQHIDDHEEKNERNNNNDDDDDDESRYTGESEYERITDGAMGFWTTLAHPPEGPRRVPGGSRREPSAIPTGAERR